MITWDQKVRRGRLDISYVLWYYPHINRFTDDYGNVIDDLSALFDAWQLDEWKRVQEDAILLDRSGNWCEICYLSKIEAGDYPFLYWTKSRPSDEDMERRSHG